MNQVLRVTVHVCLAIGACTGPVGCGGASYARQQEEAQLNAYNYRLQQYSAQLDREREELRSERILQQQERELATRRYEAERQRLAQQEAARRAEHDRRWQQDAQRRFDRQIAEAAARKKHAERKQTLRTPGYPKLGSSLSETLTNCNKQSAVLNFIKESGSERFYNCMLGEHVLYIVAIDDGRVRTTQSNHVGIHASAIASMLAKRGPIEEGSPVNGAPSYVQRGNGFFIVVYGTAEGASMMISLPENEHPKMGPNSL